MSVHRKIIRTDIMNILQAIAQRRSTRTYNGLRLDTTHLESVDRLCREGKKLLPPDITDVFKYAEPPVIVLLSDTHAEGKLGTYGIIKGARSYIAMATGETDSSRMLGGFILEKIVLSCTAMGIGTCWLGGTFSKSSFTQELDALGIGNGLRLSIVCSVGHSTPKERFAGRLMRRIDAADSRKPFSNLFTGITPPAAETVSAVFSDERFGTVTDTDEAIALALECVRRAPSSVNSQPWRANVSRNSQGVINTVTFTSAKKSWLTPFDMGIAYCHFASAAEALGIKGTFENNPDGSPLSLIYKLC